MTEFRMSGKSSLERTASSVRVRTHFPDAKTLMLSNIRSTTSTVMVVDTRLLICLLRGIKSMDMGWRLSEGEMYDEGILVVPASRLNCRLLIIQCE